MPLELVEVTDEEVVGDVVELRDGAGRVAVVGNDALVDDVEGAGRRDLLAGLQDRDQPGGEVELAGGLVHHLLEHPVVDLGAEPAVGALLVLVGLAVAAPRIITAVTWADLPAAAPSVEPFRSQFQYDAEAIAAGSIPSAVA